MLPHRSTRGYSSSECFLILLTFLWLGVCCLMLFRKNASKWLFSCEIGFLVRTHLCKLRVMHRLLVVRGVFTLVNCTLDTRLFAISL